MDILDFIPVPPNEYVVYLGIILASIIYCGLIFCMIILTLREIKKYIGKKKECENNE